MRDKTVYEDLYVDSIEPYPEAEIIFSDDVVLELAERFRQHGSMTGFLVVRRNERRTFDLVSGMKLYVVAKAAGIPKVPCLVMNLPEADALAERLREIIRSGQRGFEEALAYHIGMERFRWTIKWIMSEFGRSEGHVSQKLGLVKIYEYEPALLLAREVGQLSDRAVVALRWVLRSRVPEEEKIARVRLLAKRMLNEQWPANMAATMVKACIRAMNVGEPLPPPPDRGGRKRLLQAEIEELERRRDALLAEVTGLEAFARALDPFWAEAQRIQADVHRFLGKLSEVRPPRRDGDEGDAACVPCR